MTGAAVKPTYEELELVCRQLTDEVSRFMVVEQGLKRAKDQLDRENARFRLIQSFSEQAIKETDPKTLARVATEAVLGVFETEGGLLLEIDTQSKNRVEVSCVSGLDLTMEWLPMFDTWLAGKKSAIVFEAGSPPIESWSSLDLAQLILCPIHNRDGAMTHILGAARTASKSGYYEAYKPDITSSFTVLAKQVEALIQNLDSVRIIRQQIDELREMDQLKDQFLANTSHELRTPLNSIIGLADNIFEGIDGPTNELQNKHLTMIINSGHRLLNLVDTILDFSKIRSGNLEFNFEALNLRDFMASLKVSIVDDWSEDSGVLYAKVRGKSSPLAVRRQNLKIVCDMPKSLPYIRTDSNRLQQVLDNLLSNAIKFTEEGSVTISAKPQGDQFIEVTVKDTGVGIPEGEADKVFKDFYQVDGSASRKFEGTGLGLSITRNLVESMGGKIWVESKENVGTAFSFTVPLASPAEVASVSAREPKPAGATSIEVVESVQVAQAAPAEASAVPFAQTGAGRTILVVDDEPANIEVLATKLEARGYTVVTFEGALEVINYLESNRPDLILSDVMMPGMTGYDLCQAVRLDNRMADLPFVFVSAKVRPEDKEKGMKLGADAYLEKPVKSQSLFECVSEQLTKADGKKQIAIDAQAHEADPEEGTVVETSELNPMDQSGGGETIVIVDDEPANIEVLASKLQFKGYNVKSFFTVKETMEFMDNNPVDLVISDIMMPEYSGYDLCEWMRREVRHSLTPIMFLSAKQRTEDVVFGLNMGADDYLSKPFSSAEIFARVKTHLRMHRLQKEYKEKLRMERELVVAGLVQRMFLPARRPVVLGSNFAAYYESASEAGGDLYGFIDFPNSNECMIYIGDVTGHGVNAALMTAYVASFFSVIEQELSSTQGMSSTLEPSAVLTRLNRHLYALGKNQQCMTFQLGIVDKVKNTLRYSSASHPPPILYTPGGSGGVAVKLLTPPQGNILGFAGESQYEDVVVDLSGGSGVILYTDGLIECRNDKGQELGFRKLMKRIGQCTVGGPGEMSEHMVEVLNVFRKAAPLRDDVAWVVLRTD